MTREQALQQLKNPHLTVSEQQQLYQYIHYLDVEGVTPQAAPRKQREASKARKSSSQRKNYPPRNSNDHTN